MATYVILNSVVLSIIVLVMKKLGLQWRRRMTYLLVVLLGATIIGDSMIIGAGIVQYDPRLILGVYIGLAPVEDFFYAAAACVMIPAIWRVLERKRHAKAQATV